MSLLLLIGYSVDYVLHVTHAYETAKGKPVERVKIGIERVGMSILSAALTTILSSVKVCCSTDPVTLTNML